MIKYEPGSSSPPPTSIISSAPTMIANPSRTDASQRSKTLDRPRIRIAGGSSPLLVPRSRACSRLTRVLIPSEPLQPSTTLSPSLIIIQTPGEAISSAGSSSPSPSSANPSLKQHEIDSSRYSRRRCGGRRRWLSFDPSSRSTRTSRRRCGLVRSPS